MQNPARHKEAVKYLEYKSLINVSLGCIRHKVRRLEKTQKKFIHQLQNVHKIRHYLEMVK